MVQYIGTAKHLVFGVFFCHFCCLYNYLCYLYIFFVYIFNGLHKNIFIVILLDHIYSSHYSFPSLFAIYLCLQMQIQIDKIQFSHVYMNVRLKTEKKYVSFNFVSLGNFILYNLQWHIFSVDDIISLFITGKSIKHVYHIFFILSTVTGHTSWFHILAIMTSVVINMDIKLFLCYAFLDSFRFLLKFVIYLNHMVSLKGIFSLQ